MSGARDDENVRGGASGPQGDTYTRLPMDSRAVASYAELPPGTEAGGSHHQPSDGEAAMPMAVLNAQEQERQRLAEELHDGPAQALTNAIFQVQILDRALREDPQAARVEVAALHEMLERELDTLRAYINQLRPSLNEAAGLDDALQDSAAAFTQRTGVPVDVSLEASSAALHPAARTVVLRVAQEALRNIAKHADASRTWLTTASRDGVDGTSEWWLEVRDDGRGFDYAAVLAHPDRRHFGLRFMRERAELLGSRLSIDTYPAGGTVLRLTIATGGDRS